MVAYHVIMRNNNQHVPPVPRTIDIQLIINEKERNVETKQLMHHTLNTVNHLKYRLDGLVSIFIATSQNSF